MAPSCPSSPSLALTRLVARSEDAWALADAALSELAVLQVQVDLLRSRLVQLEQERAR